jgi:hypothetical protein
MRRLHSVYSAKGWLRWDSGMGSIFNIVGCTAALICHFAANPIAHPERRQLHRQLLNGLRDAPREIRLTNLRRAQGHCFAATIDEDLPDDNTSSTLIVFEDGKSLPRWHFRDAPKIVAEGRGAYQHAGRTIYFSSSDNSSPLENGRKYTAIHVLSTNPEAFQRLANWRKTTKATGAARLFEMLAIAWAKHFGYEQASGDGPDVSLSGVRFAIDRDARMTLTARAMAVRAIGDARWEFDVAELATADEPDARWNLRGRVDLAPNAASILESLQVDGPAGFAISFDHDSTGAIAVKLRGLRAIRPAMLAWFGDEAALTDWLAGIGRLAVAPLSAGGFGLSLDRDGSSALAAMLSDRGMDQRYELTIRPAAGARETVLRQVSA